jgi:MFS family permease
LTTAEHPAEPGVSNRWVIVALLAVVLFVNYIDRGTLPTAAQRIKDELGLSPSQLGLVLSGFYWSYALLQIPIGWVAERFGAQRVLAASLALWACATMLLGAAHSFVTLLTLRILLGIGESAGFPCVSKLLAQVVPVREIGIANGVTAFGYLFGPAVGAYCGALLMVHYGWRSMFWVFGALSLVWLLPWSRIALPRTGHTTAAAVSPDYAQILRQRSLWGTSLGLFSSNYVFYFILNWLPYYLVTERGYSEAAMARVTGSSYLVNALIAVLAGALIDRAVRGGRAGIAYKGSMALSHAGSVAAMLCIALGSPPWVLGGIFGYQVLLGIASPGAFGISQILAGPSAAARWVGVQNAIGNLAGVIAAWLTGLLAEQTHAFTAAFVVAAVISLMGLIGWVLMIREVSPIAWQREAQTGTTSPAAL